jgi:exodeoxyribonuclease VII small subunit
MDRQNSYSRTRQRLEEIVTQVRAKDVPLEKSLDLYEEALRLGSACAEMIDRTDFSAEELDADTAGAGAEGAEDAEGDEAPGGAAGEVDAEAADDVAADGTDAPAAEDADDATAEAEGGFEGAEDFEGGD